jgi:alkylation response protein AidB-like acyl-CoA dehydrogenase
MRLELPPEYYDLAASVERYLGRHWEPQHIRAHWDGQGVGSDQIWSGLAQLGIFGLLVPAACDGEGLSSLSAALVMEQIGRRCLPHPVAETVLVVTPTLEEDGSEQSAQWLRHIAAGLFVATFQDGWHGFAPWGADSDLVLVADGDDTVHCCLRADESTRATSVDPSRHIARVQPSQLVQTISSDGIGARARLRAAVAVAIELGGLSMTAIKLAVDYARVRYQFGQPIGTFQAVKHMLADAYFAVETGRRYPWVALEAIESRSAVMKEATSVAKLTMGEAATSASYAALQVHGGIGYSWECDLHFWLKRIQVLTNSFGTPEHHLQQLASSYFGHQNQLADV